MEKGAATATAARTSGAKRCIGCSKRWKNGRTHQPNVATASFSRSNSRFFRRSHILEPRSLCSGHPKAVGFAISPGHQAPHDQRHYQNEARRDRNPVHRPARSEEPLLGVVAQHKLDCDRQCRHRELDQKKHPPPHAHQSCNSDGRSAGAGNASSEHQHQKAIPIKEPLDDENPPRMQAPPELSALEQPRTPSPPDEKPPGVAKNDPQIRRHNRPPQRKPVRGDLPPCRDDDEVFGKMEACPSHNQQEEDCGGPERVEHRLNGVVRPVQPFGNRSRREAEHREKQNWPHEPSHAAY